MREISKEKMIDAIYKEIACKKWSFGCKLIEKGNPGLFITVIQANPSSGTGSAYIEDGNVITPHIVTADMQFPKFIYKYGNDIIKVEGLPNDNYWLDGYKTIGHPVMIGDCIEWIENNLPEISDREYQGVWELNKLWGNKRQSIGEQSKYCIELVYNLIKQNVKN